MATTTTWSGDTSVESSTRGNTAVIRLVRPGSCQRCMKCHETIDFVPGGDRVQVTCSVYEDGALQHIELFHPVCYHEAQRPHGDPTG